MHARRLFAALRAGLWEGLRVRLVRIAPVLALRLSRTSRNDPRALAWLGECLAARELTRAGARVLARRLRLAGVEVDLVVEDALGIACVEVKTSTARPDGAPVRWRPADRVGYDRVARQRRAADELARRVPCRPTSVRCDVVEVWIDAHGKRFALAQHRSVDRRIG
ncbi:MAG: YraN family protein [Planctomycetes bacterium]|nr:YraN family protein [Planctomycetota bacterium]